MTEEKKQLLTDIFWAMNSISYRTETETETQIVESDDEKFIIEAGRQNRRMIQFRDV